jgi:hypothetical protein
MRYYIIEENNKDGIIETVNIYLKNGWIPQGGIYKNNNYYSQAILKVESEPLIKSHHDKKYH